MLHRFVDEYRYMLGVVRDVVVLAARRCCVNVRFLDARVGQSKLASWSRQNASVPWRCSFSLA